MQDMRREPRHAVQKQGRYRTGNGVARDIIVTDLSTMGCKCHDKFSSLTVESYLSIRIGNIGPIESIVRWVKGFTFGIEFCVPLHESILHHMRSTIDDWSFNQDHKEKSEYKKHAIQNTEPKAININIRPPDLNDIIESMKYNNITFPINSHNEITDIFYTILENILIKK